MNDMSDLMRDPDPDEAVKMDDGEGDYRLREVEARFERRLSAVEAQRTRTEWTARLAGFAAVVMMATLAFTLWAVVPDERAWSVDRLATQELVLEDAEGVARGHLVTDPSGRTQLALSDRDGRQRIRLTVLADGSPGVTISDSENRPRAILAYLPDGTTNLVLADGSGVSRAVFGLDPDGSTQAVFSDRDGAIRTLVGVGVSGDPSVSIYEAEASEEGDESP